MAKIPQKRRLRRRVARSVLSFGPRMSKRVFVRSCCAALLSFGVLTCLPALAAASTCPPEGRCHDGFYFRAASGFTGYSDALISDTNADAGRDPEASISGIGTASELAVGGTVSRGLVVGGGLYGANVLTYTVTVERGESAPAELLRPSQLALVGPFVDWYTDPARGFHLQGSIGLALGVSLEPERTQLHFRDPGVGGGLMLGFGYEWWIGAEWSLGVLGRLSIAVLGEEDDGGRDFSRVAVASPAFLLSITYH
jgi:hypothetical protein